MKQIYLPLYGATCVSLSPLIWFHTWLECLHASLHTLYMLVHKHVFLHGPMCVSQSPLFCFPA